MPYDPSQRTPDMKINVSLGDFHSTHEKAQRVEELIREDIKKVPTAGLRTALSNLLAAQRLTDAEDGDDCMFAISYSGDIKKIVRELERRNRKGGKS